MTNALILKKLNKTYANGFSAINGIDLEVKQGDFFALLGPNGAGKSTIIGIISSLINKTSGEVKVFGHDLDRELNLAKKHIGLVPQEFNFNMFEPVEEIIINQGGYYGIRRKLARQRAATMLKKLDLWDKRKDMARNLSGGMKRRLMIARSLVHEPKLLILDEPTAGVDVEIRHTMWTFLEEINAAGTTIILTTHYLEEAENLCRNIAIIDQGEILQNTSMKNLLGQLNTETFILDLKQAQSTVPTLTGYKVRLKDLSCLEVEVHKSQSMNDLFTELKQQNIEVLSMRNKVNRLEELFMSILKKNASATAVNAIENTIKAN